MNDQEIRISQMGTRMHDFGVAQGANFSANSTGGQKFAMLATLLADVEKSGADQAQARGAAKSSTAAKKEARNNVRRQMKAYRDTAVALEPAHPGITKNFRLPPTNGDEALINSARAFVETATPFKTEFINHEMPATFLEDLTAAITQFESIVSSYNLYKGKSAAATAALKDKLSQILKLRRELDPIVRNKLRDDPAGLAAWESASHLERAPKKATATKTPAQTQTQGGSGTTKG